VSDSKPASNYVEPSKSNVACSGAISGSTLSDVPLSLQNSTLHTDSSVNSSTASSGGDQQSSAAATDGASLTSSSASNEKPDAKADDDNPELTLLVSTATDVVCHISPQKITVHLTHDKNW